MWTMETGLLTSAAGLVNLICFVTMKENFIWLACYVVAARLYSNSLLASLNSRVALHSASQKIQNAEFGSMPTSTFQAVHFKSVPAVGSAVTTASGIGDLDERQRT
ncbi:unnamed protein product [Mycena citricolor]|uniref:DUF6534 domain-containing protein n=1 Tax=Mycena citricolor TaxID=2018698 RepID=A0AAD2GRL3_9AGAR|nr:unnamed protein product [Mycena citricolor]